MGKWAGFVIEHGIAGVAALLVGLVAVWWVAPTTDAGVNFLLLLVFLVAFAAIELGRKLWRRAAAGPDGTTPAETETPTEAPAEAGQEAAATPGEERRPST